MTGEALRAYVIRPLRRDETEVLKDFLYEAIFVPEGMEPPDRDIFGKPELRVYTDGFGTRKGDSCLVAESDGRIVGAVWTRIMDDYGHVDDETPSFAISLYKAYRGQGIGTAMMRQMLDLLRQQFEIELSIILRYGSEILLNLIDALTDLGIVRIFSDLLHVTKR